MKAMILRAALRLLGATWRFRESIPDDCRAIIDGSERGVIAFWHGKMFPVWYRFRGRRHSALISGSNDGELLARYLSRSLGYADVIRGSSSKGGSRALEEMIDMLRRRTLLITPDGPRGPARSAKPGAMIAAARAGSRIVLAGWNCRRRAVLHSWDSMEIPYPFSQINFRYCIFDVVDASDDSDVGKDDLSNDRSIGHPVPASSNWIDDAMLTRFNTALNDVSSG